MVSFRDKMPCCSFRLSFVVFTALVAVVIVGLALGEEPAWKQPEKRRGR
jgi:hypothetical protein